LKKLNELNVGITVNKPSIYYYTSVTSEICKSANFVGHVSWLKIIVWLVAEALADSVKDTHGCYFVPAFSGLSSPYWMPDARG